MKVLEKLVTQALGLSGSPEDLKQLLESLAQQGGDDALSRSSQGDLETALNTLDPSLHSLMWLFVLDALGQHIVPRRPAAAAASAVTASLSSSAPSPSLNPAHVVSVEVAASEAAEQLVRSTITFFNVCSRPQVRLAPEKMVSVARRLRDILLSRDNPIRGVLPLRTALRQLQPTRDHITPLHADFLQLCLLARCYSAGAQLLQEDDLVEVDPAATGLTQADVLLYCYYGGMIFIGVKKMEQALDLFLSAITAPALLLSAVVVAAYKKAVLVSLMRHGKRPELPRFTPTVVLRNIKATAQEYYDLAEVYGRRDADELRAFVSNHEDTFSKDGNLGLVKQVVASVYQRNIQRLTQTYLTLSLSDIAQTVKLLTPRDAEHHILRMIEDREIFATISQRDGMVSFEEDPECYNSHRVANQLHDSIGQTMKLAKKLQEMDDQLSCDRAYLGKMHMREKHGRFGDPDDYELGPSRMFETI